MKTYPVDQPGLVVGPGWYWVRLNNDGTATILDENKAPILTETHEIGAEVPEDTPTP